MAALVESMMYVREVPWHGLGTKVEEAPTSFEALTLAGLNWEVTQQNIFTEQGIRIPNHKLNVRSTDNEILGVVSDKYKIVQNIDAFAFTDTLVSVNTGADKVYYETAGSLRNGKTIWLLARMPECKVAGDAFVPYMCFTNTHDGTGAVRVLMTPVRVVCNNTLNLAINTTPRAWSTRHLGNIHQKVAEASNTLELAGMYMSELDKEADRLANITVSDAFINIILDKLFPIEDDATELRRANTKQQRDNYMRCYLMPDLKAFKGTAWGAINAMSDMVTHAEPLRKTEKYAENNWGRVMVGHQLIDAITAMFAVSKTA